MKCRALWLAGTALTVFATPSHAQQTNWHGLASPDWFDANWTAGVPTGAHLVIIDTTGPNSTVISGGAAVSNEAHIGNVGGATGQVDVTGIGSSWTNNVQLHVGRAGNGTLHVVNGGAVTTQTGLIASFAGSTGTATVSGPDSTWHNTSQLVVGEHGTTGTLNILDRGVVTAGNATMSFAAGVISHMTVDGAGSQFHATQSLNVGMRGNATLNILNGGVVSNFNGFIGDIGADGAIGQATVSGPGSTWTSAGHLFVGRTGAGTLTLQNGGIVNATLGVRITDVVALAAGASGTLNIGAAAGSAAAAPGTLNAPEVIFGLGNGRMVFNHTSTDYTFAPSISGFGNISVLAGKTIFTGHSTFTGAVDVSGGALIVNGSIASATTTVGAGALLGGTGTVGNTVIDGTLSPGNSIGTINVNGNLTFTAAATYLVEVDPNGSDRTNVSGTATLGGARVSASFANGSYVARRYTIVNATGGVSGTFSSLVDTNLPSSFTESLSYDANNAYLDLTLDFTPASPPGTPTFGSGLNNNQTNVADALANSFNVAGGIPLAFGALTPQGLTLVSGEAATGTQQTTFDAMDLFLNVITDPFMGTRAGYAPQVGATGYANEGDALAYAGKRKGRNAAERDAYAKMAVKAPPRFSLARHWSVWAAGYGGSRSTDGNAIVGSHDVTSRIYGAAAGFDYRLAPETLVGFALGGAGTTYNLASDLGGGRSEMFQAGVYGRHTFGPTYIAAALAYGWQDITTDRNVFLNSLRANFDANAISGRLEGGYRYAFGAGGLTPYVAGQFTTFFLPDYAEQVVAGTNLFALSYAEKDVTASRTELGLRADTSFAMQDAIVTLRGRAAWAHNFNTDRSISAIFQTLPASGFVVNGAAQAENSALVSTSAEAKWLNGFSVAASFEGEFSDVTESYAGKGIVRYQW